MQPERPKLPTTDLIEPAGAQPQQSRVVSLLSAVAATAGVLWFTGYSWLGIAAMALLWLAVAIGPRRPVPARQLSATRSKPGLRFGEGMGECYTLFVPIWLTTLASPLPLVQQNHHVFGAIFAAGGFLALLPFVSRLVSFLTWFVFGGLVPFGGLWLGAWCRGHF